MSESRKRTTEELKITEGHDGKELGSMADLVPYSPEEKAAQPPLRFDAFKSSVTRSPTKALLRVPQTLSELTGPAGAGVWERLMGPAAADLTRQYAGQPLGERIIVSGRVLDENQRPVANTMVELVQANACGRYAHQYDQHDAPLDPNFTGAGQVVTNAEGGYRFLTIKPGAYPWRNNPNAWRPAHIHLAVFGPAFVTRLNTQMYFPGDPLLVYDPIFQSTADAAARERLIAQYDPGLSEPEWALGYRWDMVLRGRAATPMDPG